LDWLRSGEVAPRTTSDVGIVVDERRTACERVLGTVRRQQADLSAMVVGDR
jgi:hypothetical protein